MKYRAYLNTLAVFCAMFVVFFTAISVFAADSNTITTKVGNPAGPAPVAPGGSTTAPRDASDCPIPNGVLTCGSQRNPVNGPLGLCGHCGVGYGDVETARYCQNPADGNHLAIDIAGDDLQDIFLPKLNGHVIKWTFIDQQLGSPFTQIYTGVDMTTGDQFRLQFHHTQFKSGNEGEHFSGEKGGQICGGGCNQKHVHVQLKSSTGVWYDATQYMCRGN